MKKATNIYLNPNISAFKISDDQISRYDDILNDNLKMLRKFENAIEGFSRWSYARMVQNAPKC